MRNRSGVRGTLHRIGIMYDSIAGWESERTIIGLTIRIGRYIQIEIPPELHNKSVLVIGKPSAGKTTLLRAIARDAATRGEVVIVDTSGELCGTGVVPHRAVGNARRMFVRDPSKQHKVMSEAVQNHSPMAIVVDEIGNSFEARACCSMSQRGIQV